VQCEAALKSAKKRQYETSLQTAGLMRF